MDVETNKDHPNENKQRLFFQTLAQQGSQPPSLGFVKDSKAGRGMGKLCSGKKRKFQMCFD